MGRGYVTIAIRRKMGYPLKGYVPMNIRQSMSANEYSTIKIDDDSLHNQPQMFFPLDSKIVDDFNEKIDKYNEKIDKYLDKMNDDDTEDYKEIEDKIDYYENEIKKLTTIQKDLFFSKNPKKIDENSVKNMSLKNLEIFNRVRSGTPGNYYTNAHVIKNYYTAEERKIVADEIQKRYLYGFEKTFPKMKSYIEKENKDFNIYFQYFTGMWRRQNEFPY